MKKLIATSALGLALVGSGALGVASVAGAATTTAPAPATHHHHGLRGWAKGHRHGLRAQVVSVSASTIGVTSQALVAELRSGKSIAQVAAEHNVTAQTVVGALVKAGDTKIQAAVGSGKLTSARGQALEAKLPARAAKVVAHVFGTHSGSKTTAS